MPSLCPLSFGVDLKSARTDDDQDRLAACPDDVLQHILELAIAHDQDSLLDRQSSHPWRALSKSCAVALGGEGLGCYTEAMQLQETEGGDDTISRIREGLRDGTIPDVLLEPATPRFIRLVECLHKLTSGSFWAAIEWPGGVDEDALPLPVGIGYSHIIQIDDQDDNESDDNESDGVDARPLVEDAYNCPLLVALALEGGQHAHLRVNIEKKLPYLRQLTLVDNVLVKSFPAMLDLMPSLTYLEICLESILPWGYTVIQTLSRMMRAR